jgi:hypothetical protein
MKNPITPEGAASAQNSLPPVPTTKILASPSTWSKSLSSIPRLLLVDLVYLALRGSTAACEVENFS